MMIETAPGVVTPNERPPKGRARARCRRSGHREGTYGRKCEHWSEQHASKPTNTHVETPWGSPDAAERQCGYFSIQGCIGHGQKVTKSRKAHICR